MAKKRSVSVFDIPQEELRQISKTAIEQNAKPVSKTQQALDKPKPVTKKDEPPKAEKGAPVRKKAAPKPKANEALKVIRVRESFHRQAKGKASLSGMSLGEYIEQLINKAK